MTSNRRLWLSICGTAALLVQQAVAYAQTIDLLEPVGRLSRISPSTCAAQGQWQALFAFFCYFNAIYPWAIGMCAGIALLWTVWGGVQYTQAGGDQSKQDEAKKQIMNAIFGLLIILLSSILLRSINPSFYK